jgi:cellulose synthase operon protein C
VQHEAALFTDEQAKLGRDFTVQVWGWETLSTHILRHEEALKAFLPDVFPQMDRLIRGQEKLSEVVDDLAVGQRAVAADQSSMLAALLRIERQTAGSISRQAIWDDRSVDTLLDRQIDQIRDVLTAGRPKTALELLQGLWNGLPDGVDGRIRFRIKANIAACFLRLRRMVDVPCCLIFECELKEPHWFSTRREKNIRAPSLRGMTIRPR